jgi:hypothetical protein
MQELLCIVLISWLPKQNNKGVELDRPVEQQKGM